MRAFQLVGWGQPPELREMPVPVPGPGLVLVKQVQPGLVLVKQVLVKVGGAGACDSDLHIMQAAAPLPGITNPPFTLGHENAGWVQRLGAGVIGFAPGDPVIVYGSWGWGVCATADMAGRNVVGSRAAKPPEPQPAAV